MKAVILDEAGGPEVLKYVEDKPIPEPNKDQIRIKVKAAGVNRPDISLRQGKYPTPIHKGMVLGLEVAGTVDKVGENVAKYKVGDRVCALLFEGGYAEYTVVEAGQVLRIPKGWSDIEACSLPETIFTVWHNVFQKGNLKAGENFLVHGAASGIGVAAIQLAKAIGARPFGTAGTDEKCRAVEGLGCIKCVNYKTQDFEVELGKEGIDVILDMVGGSYVEKNLKLLKPDGRLEFINAMQGPELKADIIMIMQKRLTISGSTLRPRTPEFKAALADDVEKNVWPLLEAGKYKATIYKVFPLKQGSDAHFCLERGEHIGKIVLEVN
eukprot:TRINITY_DN3676_c0_g2_i2.p1 TRINITY_DN3676_c0_g2~~TRINITY_DN3676_c0_g2_i2.p1  ORF type:complete len:324 (+),score=76.81 TRINITY_DN3676_c0_g2_i2:149-1120(+)